MSEKILFAENEKINLADGAELYCLSTDEYKRSRLDIFFTFPADKYKSPLFRLMLSVLFRGSVGFPTLTDMNRHLDFMYDSTVYWKDYHLGANHTYRISCTTLDKKYLPTKDAELDLMGETLKVIEDVLLNPIIEKDGLLSKKFFESEVDFAIDNLNIKLNSPKSYASIKCQQMLFGDDPAGISMDGTKKILRSYTRKDITEAREEFLRCANIAAFYVGTDNPVDISAKLKGIFENIPDRAPVSIIPKYPISPTEYEEKTEKFSLVQGRLNIGLTCGSVVGDSDSAVMSVYNEILGGSSTSKLFMNVREKNSLCYYCSSGIDNCSGIMMIACGIKCENKDKALSEIKVQIEQMKAGHISDEEISFAKKGLLNALNQMPDSSSSLVVSAYKYKMLARKQMSIEERKKEIQNVSYEDIVAFAQKVTMCSVFFLDSNGKMGEEYDND